MAKPSAIVEGLQKGWNEVLSCIIVSFESLDALLELKEHVKTDDHHFFQVWIRNLFVKEMPRDKSSQALLERYVG